ALRDGSILEGYDPRGAGGNASLNATVTNGFVDADGDGHEESHMWVRMEAPDEFRWRRNETARVRLTVSGPTLLDGMRPPKTPRGNGPR
ncbi:MAG: hypothetical protein AAFY60_04340, partial [Myxococcota bacterium]